jgi:hypothetical protein
LSLTGIKNLKKTYNADIVTDSKLDIIITNTELYILKISKKIHTVKESYPNKCIIYNDNPNIVDKII